MAGRTGELVALDARHRTVQQHFGKCCSQAFAKLNPAPVDMGNAMRRANQDRPQSGEGQKEVHRPPVDIELHHGNEHPRKR